jgi:isopentenyl phosphate kinase
VQKIRQLEAALHREWQQLSQQDIRRLTGGMRRRVEAVIQARGGYTLVYIYAEKKVKHPHVFF